jgi:hypothetical protein
MTKNHARTRTLRVCRTGERVLRLVAEKQEQANLVTVPIPGAAVSASRSMPEMKCHHGRTAIRRY